MQQHYGQQPVQQAVPVQQPQPVAAQPPAAPSGPAVPNMMDSTHRLVAIILCVSGLLAFLPLVWWRVYKLRKKRLAKEERERERDRQRVAEGAGWGGWEPGPGGGAAGEGEKGKKGEGVVSEEGKGKGEGGGGGCGCGSGCGCYEEGRDAVKPDWTRGMLRPGWARGPDWRTENSWGSEGAVMPAAPEVLVEATTGKKKYAVWPDLFCSSGRPPSEGVAVSGFSEDYVGTLGGDEEDAVMRSSFRGVSETGDGRWNRAVTGGVVRHARPEDLAETPVWEEDAEPSPYRGT